MSKKVSKVASAMVGVGMLLGRVAPLFGAVRNRRKRRGQTVRRVGTGAAVGAAVGAIAGGGKGAAIGAGAGAGAGALFDQAKRA
jgi:hypothetical protein